MNEKQMNEDMEQKQVANGYPKLKPYYRPYAKITRNEKCPCGSGNKFKNCCLFSKKG